MICGRFVRGVINSYFTYLARACPDVPSNPFGFHVFSGLRRKYGIINRPLVLYVYTAVGRA